MWIRVWTWVKVLREDIILLFFAWRNPATPRYIKMLIVVAIAYLISPVDFIPDYIPALGMVDDMVILPAALLYITRLLPVKVREECEESTRIAAKRMPYIGAAVATLVTVWILLLIWGIYTLLT